MTSIRVGSASINVEAVEQKIADEWIARKPTAEVPGGFSPCVIFQKEMQDLRDLKHRLSTELHDRMEMGSAIESQDINALQNLERLTFMAETDPRGSMRREGLKAINQGNSPYPGCGLLESQRFANYMEDRNGPASGPDHSKIEVQHI